MPAPTTQPAPAAEQQNSSTQSIQSAMLNIGISMLVAGREEFQRQYRTQTSTTPAATMERVELNTRPINSVTTSTARMDLPEKRLSTDLRPTATNGWDTGSNTNEHPQRVRRTSEPGNESDTTAAHDLRRVNSEPRPLAPGGWEQQSTPIKYTQTDRQAKEPANESDTAATHDLRRANPDLKDNRSAQRVFSDYSQVTRNPELRDSEANAFHKRHATDGLEKVRASARQESDYNERLSRGNEHEKVSFGLARGDTDKTFTISLTDEVGQPKRLNFAPNKQPHWSEADMRLAAEQGVVIKTERVGSDFVTKVEIEFTKGGAFDVNGKPVYVGKEGEAAREKAQAFHAPLREFKLTDFHRGQPTDLYITGPLGSSPAAKVNVSSIQPGETRKINENFSIARTPEGELRVRCYSEGNYGVLGIWPGNHQSVIGSMSVKADEQLLSEQKVRTLTGPLENLAVSSASASDKFSVWKESFKEFKQAEAAGSLTDAEKTKARTAFAQAYEAIWLDYVSKEPDPAQALARLTLEGNKAPNKFPRLSDSAIQRFNKIAKERSEIVEIDDPFD